LKKPKTGPPPYYQLRLHYRQPDGKETRTGVLCLVAENRTTQTAYLRRLTEETRGPERLVIVSDERVPLDPGTAGLGYLDKLRKRYRDRLHEVQLPFAAYAELDALQATAGLARSGDLEIELPGGLTYPIPESEAIASHARRGRYQEQPLLKLLLG